MRNARTSKKTKQKKYPKDTIFMFWASQFFSIINMPSSLNIFFSQNN